MEINSNEKMESTEQVIERYSSKIYYSQLQAEKEVLELSFKEVTQHKHIFENDLYFAIVQNYNEAQVIYETEQLDMKKKKDVLYKIYDAYFKKIALLSYGKRRTIHADKYIQKFHKVIKKGEGNGSSLEYWMNFVKLCLPPFIIFLLGEYIFLNELEAKSSIWALILSFSAFILGFIIYVLMVYKLEGQRLYVNLKKWITYRMRPEEQERPLDILQYLKMMIPLFVAILSALIKLRMQ